MRFPSRRRFSSGEKSSDVDVSMGWSRSLLILLVLGLFLVNTPRLVGGAWVNLGAIQLVRERPVESVAYALGTARAVGADDTRPSRLMGYLLYEEGDYVGAVQALSGACDIQQHDFLAMLWLGLSYDKLGRDADALRCFSLGRSAPYLVMLGDQVAHADKEKWYMLATQADPRSELAALTLAHFYDPRQAEEARQWYLRAIELSPSNAQTYVELAILVFRQLHDYQQAERYLRRAIEVAPEDINAYMWMGHLESYRGDRAAAVEWYNRATEVNPSSGWARWYLGGTLCQMGEYEQGIQVLEEVISRDPQDAYAYYTLGKSCYSPQSSLDEAAAAFEAAIRFETRDYYLAMAHEGLGDVYLAQGNPSEAARQYQLALTFDPSNAALARKLSDFENPGE